MTAEPVAFDLGVAPSDGALASDYLSGGENGFAELYRRYYPRLVRFCTRRTGDRYLAEDVAQETLLRALRYLEGFDTSRPMWPWLKTIAGRIAYQAAQKSTYERCDDIAEVDPDSAWSDNPCLQVDEQIVLRAALHRVPDRQRAALQMRYIDDWSTAESAKFAGMSVPAFEQLLFRARRKLMAEYRRLTDTRQVGAIGALLFVGLRSLRRFGVRLRPEHATATAGVGAIGAATLSLSIAVLVAPAAPGATVALPGATVRPVTTTASISHGAAGSAAPVAQAPVRRTAAAEPVAKPATVPARPQPPAVVPPLPENPGNKPNGGAHTPEPTTPDWLPNLPLLDCENSVISCR